MGTRTVVLLRHGQYEAEGIGSLTALGRAQARAAARYLLGCVPVDVIWASTLVRARETAEIVSAELALPVKHTRTLREGMYSKIEGYEVPPSERREDRARANSVYEKFFRTSRVDKTDLVVCHGNLIRYLVCKALHAPTGRWIRMTTHHCSLTRIVVRDSGAVRVVSYNETAHLPRRLVT